MLALSRVRLEREPADRLESTLLWVSQPQVDDFEEKGQLGGRALNFEGVLLTRIIPKEFGQIAKVFDQMWLLEKAFRVIGDDVGLLLLLANGL